MSSLSVSLMMNGPHQGMVRVDIEAATDAVYITPNEALEYARVLQEAAKAAPEPGPNPWLPLLLDGRDHR